MFPEFLIQNFHRNFFIFGWEKWITLFLFYIVFMFLILGLVFEFLGFIRKYKKKFIQLTTTSLIVSGIALLVLILFVFFVAIINVFGWISGMASFIGFFVIIVSMYMFVFYLKKNNSIKILFWLIVGFFALVMVLFIAGKSEMKIEKKLNTTQLHM